MLLKNKLVEFIKIIPALYQNYNTPFLLIIFGFSSFSYIPIHFAIIYSVVSTLCFCLSANSRSLLSGRKSTVFFEGVLRKRIILFLPIFLISILISIHLSSFSRILILGITIRKLLDWLDEIILQKYEISNQSKKQLEYILFNLLTLFLLVFAIIQKNGSILFLTLLWSLSPLLLSFRTIFNQLKKIISGQEFRLSGNFTSHLISTIAIGLSTLIFRVIINKYFDDIKASQIIIGISIGAILASLSAGPIGIKLVEMINIKTIKKVLVLVFIIITTLLISFREVYATSFFLMTVMYSILGSIIMSYAQMTRNFILLQDNANKGKDFWIGMIVIATTLIVCIKFSHIDQVVSSLYLFSAIINFLIYI